MAKQDFDSAKVYLEKAIMLAKQCDLQLILVKCYVLYAKYYQEMALPAEQSYIENILRLNKGKKVRVHQTFPDSNEWRDLEFKGIIEQSGRDHIILSEPSTGKWQLLLMLYVDFITFDENINYSEEFYPNN